MLQRRVEVVARQVGMATTAMEEKVAMTDLKGSVETRQKMFNRVKQRGDMPQATVSQGLYGESGRV